jgi:hypothetical protein
MKLKFESTLNYVKITFFFDSFRLFAFVYASIFYHRLQFMRQAFLLIDLTESG